MFSEDYVLRMIRQATAVFAKLMGLKNSGQNQEALQVIDQTLEQLLDLDKETIDLLDDTSLYLLLTKNDALDLEKLQFVADLFMEKGNIQRQIKLTNESINCYLRALNYYLVICINIEPPCPLKLTQRIDELILNLISVDFEEQTLLDLFWYYENTNEYAKADDMLSKVAAKNQATAFIIDERESFYKRLLRKSPEELTRGGLSRAQIQTKLKELEASKNA